MVFMVGAQRWTRFTQGSCPWSFLVFLFLSLFGYHGSSPSFFGALALALYIPSQLILTFHLLIRQIPIRVPVPLAASPHFLLVTITETTLFSGLFPSMWLGRLLTHSMRRWRFFLEPLPHCTPVQVPFYSPFLLGALWRLPLMTCHSSPFRPRDAKDRVILGCTSRPFGFSPLVIGNYSPRRGPWALMESGPRPQILWPHNYLKIIYIYIYIYIIWLKIWHLNWNK